MKRGIKLLVLCAVLAAIIVSIIVVKNIKTHIDTINDTDEIIYTCDSDILTNIKWTYGEDTVEFNKTDDTWRDPSDEAFPVDADKIDSFLASYKSIHASFIISDVEDYEQYGLEEPECTLWFSKGDSLTTIKLGGYSTIDAKRYISVGDGNVYLIDSDPLDNIISKRDEFIENDKLPELDSVTEISFTGNNSADIVYDENNEYTYNEDDNYFYVDGDKKLGLSSSYVSTYIGSITGFALTDFATYTAGNSDLSEYGLSKPYCTVTLKGIVKAKSEEESDKEETVIFHIGEKEETTDEGTQKHYYVRLDGSELIYNISETTFGYITDNDYNSLRSTKLLECSYSKITRFEMSAYDDTYTITHTYSEPEEGEEGETVNEYKIGEQEVDGAGILDNLKSITVTEFAVDGTVVKKTDKEDITEEDTEAVADKEEERVELKLDGRIKELSVDIALDNESFKNRRLEFYRYDGESCIAVVDDEIIGLVSRTNVISFREAVYAIALNL